jgi:hypothetical protein
MRRTAALLAAAALTLGACGGDSKEDKALTQVCDARADIDKQADALRGLTLQQITGGQAADSISAIRADLETIGKAQADLSDERRAEVKEANAAFGAELRTVVGQVVAGGDSAAAQEQFRAAAEKLEATYRETYGRIDCPEE